MKKLLITFIFCAAALMPAFASAELSQKDAVSKIEKHLNNISTMKANFTQISADGGISNGKFFLARPGKLRWQYEPPVPLLIIGSGGKIQYHDLELDTVSYVNMDDTLAGLLARSDIELTNSDIEVKSYSSNAGVLRLMLAKKGKPDDGSLTLVMNESPMALRKMEIIDGARQKTVISLNDVLLDIDLSDQLFEFEDKGKEYPTRKR